MQHIYTRRLATALALLAAIATATFAWMTGRPEEGPDVLDANPTAQHAIEQEQATITPP